MPLAGRFPVHQHFYEIEKRHAIDTIGIVLWKMGLVDVVVIKRHFQLSERILVFFARVCDYRLRVLRGKWHTDRGGTALDRPASWCLPYYHNSLIFRCHPRRRELVVEMLGAKRNGFHAFGYLRHFCSTVQRLLGIETELTHIPSEGHNTALGVYPTSINAPKFEQTLDSKEFHQRREEFRLAHEGKRLVVSVERMGCGGVAGTAGCRWTMQRSGVSRPLEVPMSHAD
jgi:Glycosyltransferase family 20